MKLFNRSLSALALTALFGSFVFTLCAAPLQAKDGAKAPAKAAAKTSKKADAKADKATKQPAKKSAKKEDAQGTAPAAEPKETVEFDVALFDIPEGKDGPFYQKRMEDLNVAIRNYVQKQKDQEAAMKIFEQANEAFKTLTSKIAFATDVDEETSFTAYSSYCSGLAQEGLLDQLNEIVAAEMKKDQKSKRALFGQTIALFARVDKAVQAQDSAELAKLVDEIVATAQTNDMVAQYATQFAQFVGSADPQLSVDLLNRVVEAFKASDDPMRKSLAVTMGGEIRFRSLVGNEMLVEGLFIDGEEIDWASYRGKVVLVDFWATWCGPCVGEIPNVMKMYEKYHDAGFEVVGYSLDSDLDALKSFEEERKLPWKTASLKMSVEAEGKDFTDLMEYYGIADIPTMVLVGKDGKVIDLEARGEHLQELLQGLFPDVK